MEISTPQGDNIHDRIMASLEPVEDVKTIQNEEEEIEEQIEETPEDISEEISEDIDETPEETQEENHEEDGISTQELSGYLGLADDALDLDDEGNLLVKTKIDGEEGRAKLQDLVTSYQLRGHLDKQTKQVAEERKALQEKVSQVEQQAAERLNQLEVALQTAWAEMEQEDISHLREEDPAEWTAKQREMDEKKARLTQAYQLVQYQKQAEMTEVQTKVRQALQEEGQKLLSAVKEWADPVIAEKEVSDIYSYMANGYGFSQDDLYGVQDQAGNYQKLGIADHRYLLMARKAMKYDELVKTKPEVAKKVKKAPKIVKAGQPRQQSANSKVAELKRKVKQSGGKGRSIAEYLIATGKV